MAWMSSLKLRKRIAEGARLGAQLFVCGPMFTSEQGHGTEFLDTCRNPSEKA